MASHHVLERQLASFKRAESALVFTSGYMANLGIISALVNRGDFVFSDELNHASIIDGCRLSRATISVFAHNNMNDLEDKLIKAGQQKQLNRKLIVVDGIFSMDGDLAPLPALVQLAAKYDCMLMVDEAHATGVLGPGGRGVVAHFGLENEIPVIMGTLSKALGSMGGFVVGSKVLTEYLVNTSRSFIFSTALPPMVFMSALAAIELLESDPSLSTKVQGNAEYLRNGLKGLGFDTLNSQTQIIPIVIGEASRTIEMSRLLLQEGILATPIRPPTVPDSTCRIRTTVMATHTRQDLDFALEAFARVGNRTAVH
jgi:8-amino-7-oxononanoate synthase